MEQPFAGYRSDIALYHNEHWAPYAIIEVIRGAWPTKHKLEVLQAHGVAVFGLETSTSRLRTQDGRYLFGVDTFLKGRASSVGGLPVIALTPPHTWTRLHSRERCGGALRQFVYFDALDHLGEGADRVLAAKVEAVNGLKSAAPDWPVDCCDMPQERPNPSCSWAQHRYMGFLSGLRNSCIGVKFTANNGTQYFLGTYDEDDSSNWSRGDPEFFGMPLTGPYLNWSDVPTLGDVKVERSISREHLWDF